MVCITLFIDHVIHIYVGQKSMEGNGFKKISSHCITVLSNHCQNYKHFSCTLTIPCPH